ncbi:outer membrane beta-barrel protein [Larkinella terrae]|uniref:Outer membrane beta-barrel protein n=1 Tax=Larkinella terrae TaxID=2025311 RepID=A0A7K0EMI3_9BACT|nr:outer membrane beta-barrel protein [Larkinella terrae]MRS62751.1 hypothetical protein [Larkinella terrae]
MKKLTLLTILAWLIAVALMPSAKAQTIEKGEKFLNAGVGLGTYTYRGLPIGASFEYTIKDNLSVGGSFDFARYGYNSGGYKWNYTFLFFTARGSYHFGDILDISDSKFDPYAGISLGLRTSSYSDTYGSSRDYYSPYGNSLFLGLHLGSRYMFSEKIGGFAEIGYGVAVLRVGLTAKFK